MNSIKNFFTTFKNTVRRPLRPLNISTPAAVIIGSVMITAGLIANALIIREGGSNTGNIGKIAPSVAMFAGKSINGEDFVRGNKSSDVVVVEYSDPECPFCVQVSPTIKQIEDKYAGKIAFVYRHFPLTQIHPHAFDQARAIACSGTVGGERGFYTYIDAFYSYKFQNQTTQLAANGVFDLAKTAGLDVAKFTQCYNTQATAKIVNDQTADGIKAGVQGTPTTFVLKKSGSGYEVVALVDGSRPIEAFTAPIDEALSR